MANDAKYDAIPQRCSLKTYLENIWLPGFKRPGSPRALNQILRAQPWPEYPELQKDPGTRRLVEVQRIDQWDFILLAEDCES